MKLFKNKVCFVFTLCLLGASRTLAQTDSSVGVMVKAWGVAISPANNHGEDSEFIINGPAMETYPGASNGTGTFGADGISYSQNTTFSTPVAIARFEVNKTYLVTATGLNIKSYQELHVIAPPGYTAEIDGVQRPNITLNTITHTYTLRILSALAISARAGEASSLAGNQVQWQVSLGSLQNGTAAGSLSIVDSGTGSSWAGLFTPAGLDYLPPSSEIQVFRDSNGNIQQVLANQAVVNVVTNRSTQYDIFFYHPGQLSGSSYPYTFTGEPYVQYRVEQGGTSTTLQITSYTRTLTGYTDTDASAPVVRTAVTTIQRDGSSPNFTWTLHDWNTSGMTQATEQILSSAGAVTPTDTRAESLVVQVPGGAIATQASRTFNYYSWGEEVAAQTLGSGFGLTTNLVYNDDGSNPGSQGYLQSVVAPGGGWEAYDYWNAGSGYYFAGTTKYRYRPYNNAPATVTRDPTQGEVTYFEYLLDAFGVPTRPSLVQTSVNNVVTAKTSTGYTSTAHPSSSTLMVVTATSQQYFDASHSLTTVTKYFQEDAGVITPSETFYRSQLYSVTNPDQSMVSYSYEHGSFSESTHAFTPGSGTASRIAVITGSANSSAGSLCSPSGYGSSFAIDSVYLVDGKSTLSVTMRDSRALVRRTESYAWSGGAWNLVSYVDFVYDYAGQLTSSVASNGATTTASYAGDQKMSETDASGITLTYLYDSGGRLWTVTKSSGPTTTIAHDAANRDVSETVWTAGYGENIFSSHTYDTAGRLSSELPVGMSTINYSYNVSGRSRTASFPDTSTRTEYYLLNGQLDHVDGTAAIPEYYAYSIETDGRRTTQVYSGSSGSARWQKGTTDWLGRTTHTERPGFSVSGQANYTEDNTYDTTGGTGHLLTTARSGYAPIRYQYDALGQVTLSGLDVNNDGLVLASTDRITGADTVFENYSSAWWLKSTTTAYPFTGANAGNGVITSIKRTRLTGHPTNRLDETQVTDAEGNTVTRTVDINRTSATATITTIRPSVATNQIETVVNGLTTSVQGHDGLTSTAQYDPLGRAWKSTDSRNNTFTTAYQYGSALVQSVTDATGNALGLGTVSYTDGMGRKTLAQDANGQNTHFSYNLRGQLTNQWGGGSYPVSYGYDPTYGDRTSLNTYRSAPAGDSAGWPSVGPADPTTWTFDTASGLLWKKTDAGNQVTQFDYNVRGQTASRKWARTLVSNGSLNLTCNYGYDGNTGELLTQTYNDTGETIPTPPVTYTYTRLGQVNTVADATGSRTFNYDGTSPWRMDSEALDPGFYASRVISRNYDGTSGTGGTYGQYTPGTFKGRYIGYDLGIVGNTARDQHIAYTTSNLARFVGVDTRTTTGSPRDYVYNYYSSSSLLGGYTMGSLSIIRGYEPQRNLLTSIDSQWSGSSYTRYDYTSNALGQRVTARQSGSAFADYGQGLTYSGTYNVYNYNARGELQTTARYRGDTPTTSPVAADELPAMRFEYRYDSIGNRTTSGATGTTGDDNYTTNALNQYTAKDNKTVKVLGTAAVSANVAVTDAPSTGKVDHAWGANLVPGSSLGPVPANSTGPVMAAATVNAAVPGGGTGGQDLLRADTSRTYFVPKLSQTLGYDADGNLTNDGVWTYTYNAENQLVRMNTLLNASFTGMDVRIDFKYDYQGRRVEKSVFDYNLNNQTLDQRYLYDGPNLIAQTDASGNLQRTFTWGLDLAGSLSATGGVGALLQIDDLGAGKTLSVTYDGNGNVAGLVNSVTGALEGAYEYDPSGNLLRMEGTYAKNNPFRFSTKWQDDETGLVNFGLRYYSPSLGRFINRDPIAEKGGLNLYGFCGNDGVNGVDRLGNRNFFSSLWDNTIGAIGKGIGHAVSSLQRWSNAHPLGANLLALFVPGLQPFADLTDAHITWHAAQRNPQIAAVVAAIATWYIGGWGAGALGFSGITQTVIAGASAGFGGGFVGARASGASLSDSFRAGYQGAAWGGALAFVGGEFLNAKYTSFGWQSAAHQFATSEIRYEVGRFAENKLGMNGWTFDAALLATSFIGNKLVGDAYVEKDGEGNSTVTDNSGAHGIAGFFGRIASTGALFKGGGIGHLLAELPFDVGDTLLAYQGLPDATSLKIMWNGWKPTFGHSLGALKYSNIVGFGAVDGGAAYAEPFGMIAPSGVNVFIGDVDPITGFSLGKLLNWDAQVLHTGHFMGGYRDALEGP